MFKQEFADSIRKRLERLIPEFEKKFLEREEVIRMLLLTIMSKANAFLIGLPGLAKSDILDKLCYMIEQYTWYEKLFTKETTESAIFGRKTVANDDTECFATRGMLPEANFALLDEVFKSPKELLDSMLQAINEKKFKNGPDVQVVPLYSVFAASNELPKELDSPFFDRLHFKYKLNDIQSPDNFIRFMNGDFDRTKTISHQFTLGEIDEIGLQKQNVTTPEPIQKVLVEFWRGYNINKIRISTRTWGFVREILRVTAFCNGRNEVDFSDLCVMQWICWSDYTQREKNETLIHKILFGEKADVESTLIDVQESYEKIKSYLWSEDDFYEHRIDLSSNEEDEYALRISENEKILDRIQKNISLLTKIRYRFFMVRGIERQIEKNVFLLNIKNRVFDDSNIDRTDFFYAELLSKEGKLSSFLDKNRTKLTYENNRFYKKMND